MSEKPGEQSEPQMGFESQMKYSMELKAYKEACKADPDVKNFDEAVKQRTGKVIHSLAKGLYCVGELLIVNHVVRVVNHVVIVDTGRLLTGRQTDDETCRGTNPLNNTFRVITN